MKCEFNFTKNQQGEFDRDQEFLPSLRHVQVVLIGLRLSLSKFCQVEDEFKTQSTFFKIKFTARVQELSFFKLVFVALLRSPRSHCHSLLKIA